MISATTKHIQSYYFFSFLLVFIFSACGQDNYSSEEMAQETKAMTAGEGSASKVDVSNLEFPDDRKIIWTANLDFQVKDVNETTTKIAELCKKEGAFVARMDLNNTKYEIYNTIKIRVKSDSFSALLKKLQDEALFMRNLSINADDVTEEYLDVQTRLATKKAVRERYIDILKNKAGNIKDVIEAEEAIRKITEEIEAKEGRLKYLSNQVAMSTINLRIYQEVSYTAEPNIYIKSFSEKAVEALGNGWNGIKGFIILLLNIWPILILVSLSLWKGKWLIRKLFRKR